VCTKYTNRIHPSSPSLLTLLPPTVTHPLTGPVLPYCPSFFKCILFFPRGFALVFHTCICHTSSRLTPSITYSFYYSIAPLLFNSFQCISSYHLHIQMGWISILFTFYHSLFLYCLPITTLRHTHYCYYILSLVYLWSYTYLCIHRYSSVHSSFHMWPLSFWVWLTSLNMMIIQVLPLTCKQHNFILFYGWVIFHCVYMPHLVDLFIICRTSGLFPKRGYCE
jgi:hypothetical protein